MPELEAKLFKSAAAVRVPRITSSMSPLEAERVYMALLKGALYEDEGHPANVPREPTPEERLRREEAFRMLSSGGS